MKFCQIAVSEQAWIFSATSLTELPLSCSQCYTIGCMSCHILYEYGLVARGTFQSLPSSSPLTHSLTRYILQMVLNNIFCQCGCVSQALMSCGKQDSWKCLPIAVSVFHRVKQVFVWFIREQIFFFFTLPNIHADYLSFALQSAEALHQKDKCQLCCLKLSILQHNLQEVITLYCTYSVDFLHEFPIPSRYVKFLNPSFRMVF